MQVDSPLRQRELQALVGQLGEIELRIVGEVDRIGADAQLRARLRVGREPGAVRGRKVDLCRRPIAVAGAIEGKRAGDKAHPADARGRFRLREGRNGRQQAQQKEAFGEKAHGTTLKILAATTGEL